MENPGIFLVADYVGEVVGNNCRFKHTGGAPAGLWEVLDECMATTSASRPSLRALTNKLLRLLSHQKLVDSIMSRLENYAQDLESLVEHQTNDLLEECKKVDDLLKEIIPK